MIFLKGQKRDQDVRPYQYGVNGRKMEMARQPHSVLMWRG
ncbi:hypothetical protein NEOC95_000607 [Neochlamydia sp. AcF95]|nr:hypothetical protein [Neochlamydia sp. AcF95]